MFTTLSIMISLSLVLIFRFINKKYNSPIFGVYQRRNKYFWLKFLFMYTFLRLRQLATHIKRLLAVELGYSYDGTVHIHEHDVALEQKHPFGEHPLAVDAVYFNGMSGNGAVVVCGVARRPDNICDAFLYLKPVAVYAPATRPLLDMGLLQMRGFAILLTLGWRVGEGFNSLSEFSFSACAVEFALVYLSRLLRHLGKNEGSPILLCREPQGTMVEDGEILLTPSLPDTHMEQTAAEQGEYKVQGISVNNFIPMRTWKVSYNGDMKSKLDSKKRLKVAMNLTWSANWNAFNYDTHMSPYSMAQDMAREDWSADYFKLLKKFHQVHYEQMGFLDGSVLIDGKEHVIQNMPCVRDHSYGKLREWRNFHRYVYHFIYLENGDCMAVGAISEPVILSHLTIGYLCRKSDQTVMPVDECDFTLWQHGEHQILPKDYGFVFKAGGESYQVKLQVYEESSFYIGKIREAKFYERWSSVEVNGVRGWACVEWQYNNVAAAISA